MGTLNFDNHPPKKTQKTWRNVLSDDRPHDSEVFIGLKRINMPVL